MEESAIRELIDSIVSPVIKRVDKLEKDAGDVRVWQAKYGVYIDEIRDTVKGLVNKPQKRWDAVVAAIIACAVSAAFSLLLK